MSISPASFASFLVEESVDLDLLVRRALRVSRERVHLTQAEFAEMLNRQVEGGQYTPSWINALERTDAFFDFPALVLGLRPTGLDLAATMERWTANPRDCRPVVRPFEQRLPAAFAEMFAARRARIDVAALTGAALRVGRCRAGLSLARVADTLTAEVPLGRYRARITRYDVASIERADRLRIWAPDALVALRACGLDLIEPVSRWTSEGNL